MALSRRHKSFAGIKDPNALVLLYHWSVQEFSHTSWLGGYFTLQSESTSPIEASVDFCFWWGHLHLYMSSEDASSLRMPSSHWETCSLCGLELSKTFIVFLYLYSHLSWILIFHYERCAYFEDSSDILSEAQQVSFCLFSFLSSLQLSNNLFS